MNRRSFTLTELMISLSLSMVIFSAISYSIISAHRLNGKVRDNIVPYDNALSAVQLISSDIKAAKEISGSSTSSKLIILIDADVISYDMNSEKIRRIKNGYSQYLTADKTIKDFRVSYGADKLASVTVIATNSRSPFTMEAHCRN